MRPNNTIVLRRLLQAQTFRYALTLYWHMQKVHYLLKFQDIWS